MNNYLIPQRPDAPYFNPSASSQTFCRIGLCLSWLSGILSLIFAVYVIHVNDVYLGISSETKELLPLALNILVTLSNESSGYIHTISLRWALQREGQLEFASNLRLFGNARKSRTNSWYTNIFMMFCIVLAHASVSLIFIGDVKYIASSESNVQKMLPPGKTVYVNGYALATLALGIFGQSVVASICLYTSSRVPTWSSNVMDIAAACYASGSLSRVPGRSLRSLHDREQDTKPVAPRKSQRSIVSATRSSRIVLYFLWATVLLAIVWGVILISLVRRLAVKTPGGTQGIVNANKWSFLPVAPDSRTIETGSISNTYESVSTSYTMTVAIPWLIVVGGAKYGAIKYTSGQHIYFPSFIGLFIVSCVLQSFITLSLHCAELLVNVIRDELTWRHAAKQRGLHSQHRSDAAYALLTSFPGLTLLALKPLLHWIYSLAVSAYFSAGLVMHPPQILYLAVGAVIFAAFVTACGLWHPTGPQPAAFGHLQTLVDLIDEWPNEHQSMFWGRKELASADISLRLKPSNLQGGYGSSDFGIELSSMETRESLDMSQMNDISLIGVDKLAHASNTALLGDPKYSDDTSVSDRRKVAHAGTSSERLDPVRFDELYS